MKLKLFLLVTTLCFMSCSPLKKWQNVESKTAGLGAIGEATDDLFTKGFRKVGEPKLSTPISVHIHSVPFTKSSYSKYKKYKEHLGEEVNVQFNDSLESAPRFFQLRITDIVRLKQDLNREMNQVMLDYLEDDPGLELLTEISLVSDTPQESILTKATQAQLIQKGDRVYLEVRNNGTFIQLETSIMEIFDYETAGFCWQLNQRSRPEISTILVNGQSCPKGTEKKAKKLDVSFDYLKL
ncbi:hypothetical protein PP182_18390 [Maribacter sp. PR1]|uniref:Lipoprotein n=1 Tax=Maribacter cobaltidurans TaxID=1178778 RepID=A0ABU7IYI2_9FLAO|nr:MULTISPECIES: hypothetical protein [Maribacter]MDC6390662.1 hypothetical protein [Maribacter sp. PR1]MEE1978054.1 hypothetical protein [Maribacter cobaltidurans]